MLINTKKKPLLASMHMISGGAIVGGAMMAVNLYQKDGQIDFGMVLTVLGTVITALSFVAGAYFALLAVSAYGHVKEIRNFATQSEATLSKIESGEEKLHAIRNESVKALAEAAVSKQAAYDVTKDLFSQADALFLFMQRFMTVNMPDRETLEKAGIPKEQFSKAIEEVACVRSRFFLQNPFCVGQEKMSHILVARQYCDKKALHVLRQIANDESVDTFVRKAATEAIDEIELSVAHREESRVRTHNQ